MKLTGKQALGIFSLAFGRTEDERRPTFDAFAKQMGVDAPSRKPLVDAGLITTSKEGRVSRIELTDAGWAWAASNLQSKLSPPSKKSSRVLEDVLGRLAGFLEHREIALAEFVSDRQASPRDLPTRLREAGLAIGGGPGQRVRLSEIRHVLADVPRDALDAALVDLQRLKKLALYPIDDPNDIRPEDEQAALRVAGNPRHILYFLES